MAIIGGQVPEPIPGPAAPHRVVVKFKPGMTVPRADHEPEQLAGEARKHWTDLEAATPGLSLEPYFSTLDEEAREHFTRDKDRDDEAARLLHAYFSVICPEDVDPHAVSAKIHDWASVETAYVESGPTPPPLHPSNNPRNINQHYQDPAPVGIDARWVWSIADGSGVGFVDVEQGWTLDHEDLAAANIGIISGVNQAYPGHGTAVLGEVVAVDNHLGGMGTAPMANARVVSQYRTATRYNTAEAILSAAAVMGAGDVMLIEAQVTYPNVAGYLPVEVERATFDAIVAATGKGIVVVEAGGNGAVDLDAFRDSANKRILRRGDPDFRDSGAILVGAGSSTVPHSRLGFSNHGSRVDCYAWGENVDTAGDGWTGNLKGSYTSQFGGTSGATPIVTGAAILLQSWRVGLGLPRYSPFEMRAILSNPEVNIRSAQPGTDQIGVMPDLKAIVARERLTSSVKDSRWWAVFEILFGVIQDGGGVVFQPGRGPVPVGPWGPRVERLSETTREILVGLAISELSTLVGDRSRRLAVNEGAIALMRKALDHEAAV